jgi:hypothetical protein
MKKQNNWPQQLIDSELVENPEDWSEFCAPGSKALEHMVPISSECSLRVISFEPASPAYSYPVIFMPGIVSTMYSFKHLVKEMNKHFILHYVDTREKKSSILSQSAKYDVESIGDDIVELVRYFGFREKSYILSGASLSATAIIDCYGKLAVKPYYLGLLEPNAIFDYPRWAMQVVRFSLFLKKMTTGRNSSPFTTGPNKHILRYIAVWYLKNFRLNMKEDAEMFDISKRALRSADPYKLRKTVLSICDYEIWEKLSDIDTPAFMVGASKDTLHRHDDIVRIMNGIKNCTYVDLEDHVRTNGSEFVELFLDEINKSGRP